MCFVLLHDITQQNDKTCMGTPCDASVEHYLAVDALLFDIYILFALATCSTVDKCVVCSADETKCTECKPGFQVKSADDTCEGKSLFLFDQ